MPKRDPDLRTFVRENSPVAFRRLLDRHVDAVHSTARRVLGDRRDLAEDVAQLVFLRLASKAHSLPDTIVVGAWLHRQTVRLALNTVRGETRRNKREQRSIEIQSIDAMNSDIPEPTWTDVMPHVDQAILELGDREREALALRFQERKELADVADRLGITTAAAQKCVSRALEKLRTRLSHRGITLSTVVIGTMFAKHAAEAAPATLANSIATVAADQLAAASTSTLISTLTTMTLTKFLVLGSVLSLVAGGLWATRTPDSDPLDTGAAQLEESLVQSPSLRSKRAPDPEPSVKIEEPRLSALPKKPAPTPEEELEAELEKLVREQVGYWQLFGLPEGGEGDFSEYLKGVFLKDAEGDLRKAVGAAGEMLMYQKQKFERNQKRRKPIVTLAGAEKYLGKIEATAADYAALASLSMSPELYKAAAGEFPDDVSAQLASLLNEKRFLQDADAIAAFAERSPDTAWPAMLEARRALEEGDFAAASAALTGLEGKPIPQFEAEFQEAAVRYLGSEMDLNDAEARSHQALGHLNDLHSPAFLMDLIRRAGDALESAESDRSAVVELAGSTIGLAQAWHESATTLADRWDSAVELRDLLTTLGAEDGQSLLTQPYGEALEEATQAATTFRAELRALHGYLKTASTEQAEAFRSRSQDVGESAAFAELKIAPIDEC